MAKADKTARINSIGHKPLLKPLKMDAGDILKSKPVIKTEKILNIFLLGDRKCERACCPSGSFVSYSEMHNMSQDPQYLLSPHAVDAYLRHPTSKARFPYITSQSGFSKDLSQLLDQVKGDYRQLLGHPELLNIQENFSRSMLPRNKEDPIFILIPFCDTIKWTPGHWFSIVVRGYPAESRASIVAYDSLGYCSKKKVKAKGSHSFVVDLMDLLRHIIGTEIFESPPKWETLYDTVSAVPFIFTYF
jgi:hypothetical protein